MTRREFNELLREYKLRVAANNIESLLSMAKYHADSADKSCDDAIKRLDEYQKEKNG
jgi:hypothetical protein